MAEPGEHGYFPRIVEEMRDITGREIEYRDECIYFVE